jgi:hypothetical protein
MAPAIATFFKSNSKTIVKWAVVAAVIFVAYRLLKTLAGNASDLIQNAFGGNVRELAEQAVPTDGTTLDGDFDAQAKSIADGQYSAMQGWGTDEHSLFSPLYTLNGAQLVKVYEKFGVRDGWNLFQWYSDELSSMFDWTPWSNDASQGCTSVFDGCGEKSFMRGIWAKSGLPISF